MVRLAEAVESRRKMTTLDFNLVRLDWFGRECESRHIRFVAIAIAKSHCECDNCVYLSNSANCEAVDVPIHLTSL